MVNVAMPKELLLELFTKKMFFNLIPVIFVYCIIFYIYFKLGMQILGVKKEIGIKKIFPVAFVMSLYALSAQLVLSVFIYSLILTILVGCLLAVIGKFNILKAIWASLIAYLSVILSDFIVVGPMCLNKNILHFFTGTIYGNLIGSLTETSISALLLFILPKFPRISLIPTIPSLFKKKMRLFDIVRVVIYGGMVYVIYGASLRLFSVLKEDPQHYLKSMCYELITMFLIIPGHHIIIKYYKKELQEQIVELLQENEEMAELNSQLKSNSISPEELIDKISDNIVAKLQGGAIPNFLPNGNRTEKKEAPMYLTPEEITILRLIAIDDKTNKEIAAIMNYSEDTIKNIVSRLLKKLKCSRRIHLAVYAVKYNIVKEGEIDI